MKNNQVLLFLILPFFIFSCKNDSSGKTENAVVEKEVLHQKIHLSISNIPKIKFKVNTGFKSYKIDKSPTLTYKTLNVANALEIKYDTIKNTIEKDFDIDTMYLKLRYNPGKHKTFILRRGDSAKINYINQEPVLELKNRLFKKHDLDVVDAISKYDSIDDNWVFSYLNPLNRGNMKKEEQKVIKSYTKILSTLDSLSKNDLLSDAEYHFYKKKYTYKKATKEKQFDIKKLKETDLHIDAYVFYLRQYVFKNLKKKIVSLGNGSSRNFLESFDFVYANKYFSLENKKHLLKKSLRNIKIDYPKSVYSNRRKKYNNLFPKDSITVKKSENTKTLIKHAKDVLLIDSKDNNLTLDKILKDNRGKVIYIDFWASWCAPCREAFPSYANLKKEYTNKEIVFIFISGDKDFNKWIIANNEEKLTNSYFAENYPKAKFYADLNIKSFPRYLIFNSEGDLVNSKAPGPDSDNIRGFFDELIKK